MWGFELLPESGGAPVPVPEGETVLGRGPLLGISDKRVSRNHALLENSQGRLRLRATHVNPVFLQSRSDPGPVPLTRGQWTVLQPGDTVSLLPGHLHYKVRQIPDPDSDQDPDQGQTQELSPVHDQNQSLDQREQCPGTPRNSQAFEEDPGPEESPQTSAPIGQQKTQAPPTPTVVQSYAEEERSRLKKSPSRSPAGARDQVRSPPRTRVLPAWMLSSSSGAVKHGKSSSSSKQTPVTSSARKAPPPMMSARAGLSEEEEEEARQPKKRRKKMNGSERVPEAPAPAISPEPSPSPESRPNPELRTRPAQRPDLSPCPNLDSVPGPVSVPAAAKPSATTTKRPQCPYGKDCYRKNPLHFQEESHPGDQDYEDLVQDQNSEQDSDRPECPYGTDCYRKNPLHRKEFKHSKRPVRKVRGTTTKHRDLEEDEDDEDEYESSFIDSESDYEPPAQRSSSESEDLSQLQREATHFVRSRK